VTSLQPLEPAQTQAPHNPPPPLTCDTHAHVFGPYDRFPLPVAASYPPPSASFEKYQAMLRSAGSRRGVLVQPSPYATDTRALCDALLKAGGTLRGVAAATRDATEEDLAALDRAGVRGLRFTEMLLPDGNPYQGSVGIDQLPSLARRMKSLDWLPHVWAKCGDCCDIAERFSGTGLSFVFDQMAMLSIEKGLADPPFQRLLALLREGRIWVKLTLCRVSKLRPNYEDARPFHDALIEANSDRLLWGSDWPFVRMGDTAPNVGHLLDLFHAWVPDVGLRGKILVENPAALYRL
jgi:2-pyrone-4,6-dicarboxylate lactonase